MARNRTLRARNLPHRFSRRRSVGGMARRLMIEPLEVRSLLSVGLLVATSSDDLSHSGLSLRDAIVDANADAAVGVSATITFDPSLNGAIITLTQGPLELTAGSGKTTIDGGGQIAVSGNNANRVFQVDSRANAVLANLSIEGGSVSNSSVFDSSAFGGGIYNAGALTVSNANVAGNSVYSKFFDVYGGGIYNSGTLSVTNSTFSGNSATDSMDYGYGGGAIYNAGALSVSSSTFSANSATGTEAYGGAINNAGTLAVAGSTFSDNTANGYIGDSYGGALYNSSSATVNNSTFAGNSAQALDYGYGGAVDNGGTLTVCDATFSGNSASARGGFGFGGAFLNAATLTLTNSIVAGNSVSGVYGTAYSDIDGAVADTSANNLIGDGTGLSGISNADANDNQVGTDSSPIDPLLGPLANNGGPTETMALLPGSPAIDTGSNALIPSGVTTDQRGLARIVNGTVDMGAFESRGFTISVTGDDNQQATAGTQFASPLQVAVGSSFGEPVAGGQVTFSAPGSGASATFSGTSVLAATIDADGLANVAAAANATLGVYTVAATAAGAAGEADFHLGNIELPSLVVTTAADVVDPFDGVTSLREAIAYADSLSGDNTITFDPSLNGATITLTQGQLELTAGSGKTTIDGGGQIAVSGNNANRVFQVDSRANAVLANLSIEGGSVSNSSVFDSSAFGGGIYNAGALTVSNANVAGNSVYSKFFDVYGGGIYNSGTLSVTNSTFSGNSATDSMDYGYGGGAIYNAGALSVSSSTFSANSATGTEAYGGAINNAGTLAVAGSTFSDNTANGYIGDSYGGALYNSSSATVNNSTFAGNSAQALDYGYGGAVDNGGTLTVCDATFSGNSASARGGFGFGGAFLNAATLTLTNSIVAGNSVSGVYGTAYSDIDGAVAGTSANNLIGDGTGLSGISNADANDNQVGTDSSPIDPLLGPLADNGGPTQTMALLPGSPAIDAGDDSALGPPLNLAADQRGLPFVREVGGAR